MAEESHPKTEPQYEHINDVTVSVVDTAAAVSPASITDAPPQKASPVTKLPSRPRKIRKLSPSAAAAAAAAAQSSDLVPRIVARSLSCHGELEAAISYLRSSDPRLAPLIDLHAPPSLEPFLPPFLALTKNILFQQLAFKAGTSIYTRFISLCGGESNVLPDVVFSLTPQQLRQIGISARKASYLHDLARKYQTAILSDKSIIEMDDKSLFTMLTMVNGIGSWSVHMFMIFSLHRPDVLPIHDLGIRKGVQMLNELEDLPRPSQMDQLCEKWRPYRSVAAWYIWRFVEAKNTNSNTNVVVTDLDASLQQQQQEQHQLHQQFLDPMNGIMNLGYFFPVPSSFE
nr:DNA-3-methyladenine glycosylase 1-like [Ipomoea batatas]